MIDGVVVTALRRIPDERGTVLHMLRADADHFEGFGEIYFATAYPGVVKAWHRHRVMTLNYAVPSGTIRLGLHDDRPGSPTRGEVNELFVGEDDYALVRIPPGVWNGWTPVGTERAIVANCATHPHTAGEMDRRDPFDAGIGFDWGIRHR